LIKTLFLPLTHEPGWCISWADVTASVQLCSVRSGRLLAAIAVSGEAVGVAVPRCIADAGPFPGDGPEMAAEVADQETRLLSAAGPLASAAVRLLAR
jgi:hypothetical protein